MQQKVLNAEESMKDSQEVHIRPDEEVEAKPNKRHRGSHLKLSTKRGPQHRKGRKAGRR